MRALNLKLLMSCAIIGGCASTPLNEAYPKVSASVETAEVNSTGDAADDPAIWVNSEDPLKSRVLGTDKQAGLYVFDLDGDVTQFLPTGELNNVDLRQQVVFSDGISVDLVAATNRTINGVSLFTIDSKGVVSEAGSFPVPTTEPYGLCVGYDESGYRVFVTYKTGEVEIHEITASAGGTAFSAKLTGTLKLATQLEGCSYDEVQNLLFVGEEETGLWRIALDGAEEIGRQLIDQVGSATGLVGDVEGIDLWRGGGNSGYLVASAQSANRYVVYERAIPNRWAGTFAIAATDDGAIDEVSHTDGLTISSTSFGANFPDGMLVVQDDTNGDDSRIQNFKFVSWRNIADAIHGQKLEQ